MNSVAIAIGWNGRLGTRFVHRKEVAGGLARVDTSPSSRELKGKAMSTLKAFFDAGKSIVTLGITANAASRQEIRDVSGKLADELDRGLLLADGWLGGARDVHGDAALVQHLRNGKGQLMNSFHENDVCAALYRLADQFGQLFDPTRFAVSIAGYREIPDLVQHLKNGERAVIDDLDDAVRQLDDLAYRLDSAAPAQAEVVRREIADAVLQHRQAVDTHRKNLRQLRRRIVDAL